METLENTKEMNTVCGVDYRVIKLDENEEILNRWKKIR